MALSPHQLTDLHARLVEAVLLHDPQAKRERGLLRFRCPLHEDSTPSAWLRDYTWGCLAGCEHKGLLRTLAEALGVPMPSGSGYTLEEYAQEKSLLAPRLQRWHVSTQEHTSKKTGNVRDVVAMEYRGTQGELLRTRLRTPGPKKAIRWWSDEDPGGESVYLYGLWLLEKFERHKPLLLVEGESDSHSLWSAGYQALGMPGADTWRPQWNQYLDGFREVYLWVEPDAGGKNVAKRLVQAYPKVRLLYASEYKDASDAFRHLGVGFGDWLEEQLRGALKAGVTKAPVRIEVVDQATMERWIEEKKKPISAVPAFLPAWAGICPSEVGPHQGWHVVIAGNTGFGKTQILTNQIAHSIALGERVGVVTLEMDRIDIDDRILSAQTGMPWYKLVQGKYFCEQTYRAAMRRRLEAFEEYGGALIINREPLSDLGKIRDTMLHMIEQHECTTIALDYMQLAYVKAENSLARIQRVSNTVRGVAVDHRVLTLALSQLKREASQDYTQTPTAQSLMGGSPLENDSMQIGIIDHSRRDPWYTPSGEGKQLQGWDSWLCFVKNRYGATLDIPIRFDPRTMLITQRRKEEQE